MARGDCILYWVLTPCNLVSFHHLLFDPFTFFVLPCEPYPSGNYHSIVCVYEYVEKHSLKRQIGKLKIVGREETGLAALQCLPEEIQGTRNEVPG